MLHIKMTSTCSTVVVHLPHHPNVKGSSSATAVGTSRGDVVDTYGVVVDHLPHHPNVRGLSSATALVPRKKVLKHFVGENGKH